MNMQGSKERKFEEKVKVKSRPKGLKLYSKRTPTQVFFCEYCEILQHFYNLSFIVFLFYA